MILEVSSNEGVDKQLTLLKAVNDRALSLEARELNDGAF